jgi:hypothetical protein
MRGSTQKIFDQLQKKLELDGIFSFLENYFCYPGAANSISVQSDLAFLLFAILLRDLFSASDHIYLYTAM